MGVVTALHGKRREGLRVGGGREGAHLAGMWERPQIIRAYPGLFFPALVGIGPS